MCNEHAVERIAMMERQVSERVGMLDGDGEHFERLSSEHLGEVVR